MKKSSKNYFTKETEDWIVKYNNSTDQEERNKIFTEHIYYPFYKLAENIIHTFKFYHTDVDQIEDLKLDVVSMLYKEKIGLFNPDRGTKAFSYFGTIVKRWLMAYSNSNYNRKKKQVSILDYGDQFQENPSDDVETAPTMTLSKFIDNWVTGVYDRLEIMFPKEADRKIADAVLTVFKTRGSLDVFGKKALYIYVREIAGCETPYLTKVVLKLKEDFYEKYKNAISKGLLDSETNTDSYL